ncbi:sugar phosphate isomerase/epimerase [Erwinia papayae]|uniref:Sugar phosphate isomerase/epimerase n=1 Tax=Erwinia papayae TaxID=206499 RepID=A0ABV3N3L6_9GAMM
MTAEVIVVTSAYGAERIEQMGGQQAVLPVIAAAGADGVEIRRELLSDAELERLPALASAISAAGLHAIYSVPEALFTHSGQLNPELDRHLAEAQQLQARAIKYSLGHFRRGVGNTSLREKLAACSLTLLVENDQTDCGRLSALDNYFRHQDDTLPRGNMVFDTGNWLWVGDSPLLAAERLGGFVSYIHVKAAMSGDKGWCAIPLDEASDLWRQTLKQLPAGVPRGIEFPLSGDDLIAVTRHYVDLLRQE